MILAGKTFSDTSSFLDYPISLFSTWPLEHGRTGEVCIFQSVPIYFRPDAQ